MVRSAEFHVWKSSRVWISISYLTAFLAILLGVLGGSGLRWAVIAANACLVLAFVAGAAGLVHLWWKPRHRVSLPLKAVGTLVGLVPAGILLLILIAIALRS